MTEDKGTRRRIITGEDVQYLPDGARLDVPRGTILTDIAREWIEKKKIQLQTGLAGSSRKAGSSSKAPSETAARIAVGSDHGGFEMKEQLKSILAGWHLGVYDYGTHSKDSVDYPDFAHAVAVAVSLGQASLGIVIDGAGIGSAIAANKVPGIRAGACLSEKAARNGREHNDLNVMTLGAGLMDPLELERIVHTFVHTRISEARHRARVQKIMDIEKKYARPIE